LGRDHKDQKGKKTGERKREEVENGRYLPTPFPKRIAVAAAIEIVEGRGGKKRKKEGKEK